MHMDTDSHARKFQKDLSSGTVALAMLAVLNAAREPLYGYQIAKLLEERAGGTLTEIESAEHPQRTDAGIGSGIDTAIDSGMDTGVDTAAAVENPTDGNAR